MRVYKYDAIILGAGAAGMMCAMQAARRGRRVVVLERAERAGKKILISGGGRCNFTNLHCTANFFISSNMHFFMSSLARYTPGDFIALVEKHRIPYHEKTLGQLFCDRSSQDILGMLEAECASAGAQILTEISIGEIRRGDEFVVRAGEDEFRAPALVVATGGLSIPKMGATDFGYVLARQFGLKIRETRPGLVPLTFNDEEREWFAELAGVSTEVITECEGQRFREKMLMTHRGLSGPGDSANFFLLEKATASPHRSGARQGSDRRIAAISFAANRRSFANRTAENPAESSGEKLGRKACAFRLDQCCVARIRARAS